MVVICGDIGATNSRLGLAEVKGVKLKWIGQASLKNKDFQSFYDLLRHFLSSTPPDKAPQLGGFGIAGPVSTSPKGEASVTITNFPWQIKASEIKKTCRLKHVVLMNDLECIASGLPYLGPKDFLRLNKSKARSTPHLNVTAILAPGSGIGEALIVETKKQKQILPSEGGHSSFSPVGFLQIELLAYLAKRYPHVSWERVLSGPGLENIFTFLSERKGKKEILPAEAGTFRLPTAEDITTEALKDVHSTSHRAVELFLDIMAVEAGNLALRTLPKGGIYIAGGIVPRLTKIFDREKFLNKLSFKGRMSELVKTVPISIVCNTNVGMIGAAFCAVKGKA